jgi:hypothetical protein
VTCIRLGLLLFARLSRTLLLCLCICLCALASACGTRHKDGPDGSSAEPRKPGALGSQEREGDSVDKADNPQAVVLDFIKGNASCALGHRGTLIDFGDEAQKSRKVRVRGTKDAHVEAKAVEHGGATWLRISGREVSVPFQAPINMEGNTQRDSQTLAVGLRIQGGTARSASVYINGKAVGAIKLARAEITVAQLKVSNVTLKEAENELSLRFNGMGRGSDTAAELDWARVGPYDDESPYAAPTHNDAVDTIRLKSVPRQAISLRAPGFARCVSYLPKGARLVTALGLTGGGEADVEIRSARDRKPVSILSTVHLTSDQAWKPIDLPVGDEDAFAEVQLVVLRAGKGARVSFAEPKIVTSKAAEGGNKLKNSTSAVVVVLGSMAPKMISAYGGPYEMPELGALAATGVVFDAYRSSSNGAGGAMASLLTGMDVDQHGVTDALTRLPSTLTTIADCAREGGIQTAYYSANPMTGTAFGFDRGPPSAQRMQATRAHSPKCSTTHPIGSRHTETLVSWLSFMRAEGIHRGT